VLLHYDDLAWRCFYIFLLKYPENAIMTTETPLPSKTDENGRKSEIHLPLLSHPKQCYATYVPLRSTTVAIMKCVHVSFIYTTLLAPTFSSQ